MPKDPRTSQLHEKIATAVCEYYDNPSPFISSWELWRGAKEIYACFLMAACASGITKDQAIAFQNHYLQDNWSSIQEQANQSLNPNTDNN